MADVSFESQPQTPQVEFRGTFPLERIPQTPDTREGQLLIPSSETSGKGVLKDGALNIPEINTPGWKEADNLSDSEKSILGAAAGSLGETLWNFGPGAQHTENGKFGGATTIGNIMDQAGFPGIDNPSVVGALGQLHDKFGFESKPLSEGKPGDIVADTVRHRIGIIGENNTMYHMGLDGKLKQLPLMNTPDARAWAQK
ncbi:MAG: hypothetical protein KC777_10015 [Cyanobacteria bacterium HKST-UBA02]|nr:hypothetical protein [Cyanobacteria bacterium HKST-UBA02]